MRNRIFTALLMCVLTLSGCGKGNGSDEPVTLSGHEFRERAELRYAECFTIDRYEDGYSVIRTNGRDYLVVPENGSVPDGLDGSMTVIQRPVRNVYLAATSAMGLFAALGEGGAIRFSGTRAGDWYIDYAKNALERGDMLYAGKYREPDYELLLSEGCSLSIQSTMIDHSPDVKEKLEELGIPVFIDYSSYETHPLGRSEWIKVYGEMTGKSAEAQKLFDEQSAYLDKLSASESTGKTVVFFYINSAGQIVTRKSGDYVTKMIELAGGENVFRSLGSESSSSTVVVEAERFYSEARDADYIIYNSTIGGEIYSVSDLIAKNGIFADFKAVRDGNVWCSEGSLFQETMKTGTVISDFHTIFTGGGEDKVRFLYKVKGGGENE